MVSLGIGSFKERLFQKDLFGSITQQLYNPESHPLSSALTEFTSKLLDGKLLSYHCEVASLKISCNSCGSQLYHTVTYSKHISSRKKNSLFCFLFVLSYSVYLLFIFFIKYLTQGILFFSYLFDSNIICQKIIPQLNHLFALAQRLANKLLYKYLNT